MIGAGGWRASTGHRDSFAATGVGAEATISCEGRCKDERGVEVKGAHLYLIM